MNVCVTSAGVTQRGDAITLLSVVWWSGRQWLHYSLTRIPRIPRAKRICSTNPWFELYVKWLPLIRIFGTKRLVRRIHDFELCVFEEYVFDCNLFHLVCMHKGLEHNSSFSTKAVSIKLTWALLLTYISIFSKYQKVPRYSQLEIPKEMCICI